MGESELNDDVASAGHLAASAAAEGLIASALGTDMSLFEHLAPPRPLEPRQHVRLISTTTSPSSADRPQTMRL